MTKNNAVSFGYEFRQRVENATSIVNEFQCKFNYVDTGMKEAGRHFGDRPDVLNDVRQNTFRDGYAEALRLLQSAENVVKRLKDFAAPYKDDPFVKRILESEMFDSSKYHDYLERRKNETIDTAAKEYGLQLQSS